ncbi:MotA/TolQ/ExbB proton channel family protein [Nitrosococcus wardiae]|uniref:MotA/TolQ/ExbB proton channel family protein n=1 Tax=Nitrosococcus wardiae TaxID=1814290 RepID=A0A4P7BUV8_9GAMM|nr:MotA/TolQ/ExbB proton channel family protein [Nitrosococcus wardiae]QBQ53621.1 MotA/TolQ/ExbB proton channel family protein [Nitrosococcus wardiae]
MRAIRLGTLSGDRNLFLKAKGMAALIGIIMLGAPMGSWGAKTPETLDQLLEQVRQDSIQERQLNAEREARFLSARDQQRNLLERAKAELAAAQKREEKLRRIFEQNEETLAENEAALKERSASLGELFGVARQTAHDLLHIINHSLVSAQFPGRAEVLETIAERKQLPTIDELQQLWLSLQEQMTESGKVVTFSAPVIIAGGEVEERQVSRIGTFTAVSEGTYLRYLSEPINGLVELSRQPPSRFLEAAAEFEKAERGEVAPMAVDPSRGAILALFVQKPNLQEHIQQGGWIGYLILGLGAIALLIALQRFIYLQIIGRRIHRQRQQEMPQNNNPLGRILGVYKDNGQDVETLHLKLDEAILKEIPRLERGLPTLAILAAIPPLLGLLGTVTGMIETFQSITLFGTGDPKLMSGGISEALVTTELGLAVAIPILLIHSGLSSKSNRLVQVLDEESAAIVAQRAEKQNGRTGGQPLSD